MIFFIDVANWQQRRPQRHSKFRCLETSVTANLIFSLAAYLL